VKLTLEPTNAIISVNRAHCRIWEGQTARGVRVHAYIALVGVRDGDDTREFEAELHEQHPRAVSPELAGIPLRLFVD
jgi:hypothetical protein